MRQIHLTNAEGRDATVLWATIKPAKPNTLGLRDGNVQFRRYLASTESTTHEALAAKYGEDYAQALIDGDPEIDMEQLGVTLGPTDTVFLSSEGNVLFAAPRIQEVLLGPDGEERERRDPVDSPSNINDTDPLRWTPRKMSRKDAVRRFAFGRTLQIQHHDGLTYDYLYNMAKELDEADTMVLVGAGPKGRDALVFQANGTPYRAFLEGRVDGEKYQLLLHLSNLELKRPGAPS